MITDLFAFANIPQLKGLPEYCREQAVPWPKISEGRGIMPWDLRWEIGDWCFEAGWSWKHGGFVDCKMTRLSVMEAYWDEREWGTSGMHPNFLLEYLKGEKRVPE